jgi:hypothetical protein
MIPSNEPDPIPTRAIRASYVTAFLILDGLGPSTHPHWRDSRPVFYDFLLNGVEDD